MTETADYDKSATPGAHKTSHQDGGADEINVTGLNGALADNQTSSWDLVSGKPTSFAPSGHHAAHEPGGSDALITYGTKTTAALNKTIGATGDYATFAAARAALPDLFAHPVILTLQTGTVLDEVCTLANKHGISTSAYLRIAAERYYPTTGTIPTADSATATTLRDAALATAALGNDYFNNCWVFIVAGTGTDNGFVPITDYVDATGDIVVDSWPGTQPDATSRYMIAGALIDGGGIRNYGIYTHHCTTAMYLYGIGIKDSLLYNVWVDYNTTFAQLYCGIYNSGRAGMYLRGITTLNISYNGIVKCNTNSFTNHAGIYALAVQFGYGVYNALSENNLNGYHVSNGGYSSMYGCFGINNGLWGVYASDGSIAHVYGVECSGASGKHSNGVGDGSLAY